MLECNGTGRQLASRANSRLNQHKTTIKRKASAVWRGDLKAGKGTISTESGTLKEAQYSFSTRSENGVGTNPEELIAAAHAGCFSKAFSAELGKAGITPRVYCHPRDDHHGKDRRRFHRDVTQSHLDVTAECARAGQSQSAGNRQRRQGGLPDLPSPQSKRYDGRHTRNLAGQIRTRFVS